MSFILKKEKTGSTPFVLVDEEKGYMRLEGVCFHENVFEFFSEIKSWLDVFLKKDFDSFTFDCALEYFNSSTAKLLSNMISDMDESDNGKNIVVNWITTEDNEIIMESGEDFKEDIVNLEFNLVIE